MDFQFPLAASQGPSLDPQLRRFSARDVDGSGSLEPEDMAAFYAIPLKTARQLCLLFSESGAVSVAEFPRLDAFMLQLEIGFEEIGTDSISVAQAFRVCEAAVPGARFQAVEMVCRLLGLERLGIGDLIRLAAHIALAERVAAGLNGRLPVKEAAAIWALF